MIKYFILVMASLWVVACMAHDERYYNLHPNALQKVIAECPQKQPTGISCEQLKNIASQVNDLAYQLRLSPQGYGKEILALQEMIAKQEGLLHGDTNQQEQQVTLAENKQQLEARLAVVKWLESPGGP